MEIKILGTGCFNCKLLEANVKKALEESNKVATIIKVTEITDIMSYGILSTPGLVIDEKVVSYGKVCSVGEIKKLLI